MELRLVHRLTNTQIAELGPFYQKWGFTEVLGELRFMRLTQTD